MRLTNPIRNFLIDHDYYIDVYEDKIHIFHYVDILKLQDEVILLQMESFRLLIKGESFRVQKLMNREMLISGNLREMSFIHE